MYKRIWELQNIPHTTVSEMELYQVLREEEPANILRKEPDHCKKVAYILSSRYCQATPQTLQNLANFYGITRERVRQLEKTGLDSIVKRWNKRKTDWLPADTRLIIAAYGLDSVPEE